MNVIESLKEKNIRPSMQRVKILEYLISVKSHPTADEIFEVLLPQIPTLSKTSVYNTMKLLVDAGFSKAITIEGQQMRFDADTSLHGHFKCDNCGRITDFMVSLADEGLEDFEILTREVYYSGRCSQCANQNIK